MKKITFTRYGTISGWWQSPGYLLTHSCHPDRKFVITRGSGVKGGQSLPSKTRWALFDMESGYCLNAYMGNTRAQAEEHAIAKLSTKYTPEWVVEKITKARLNHVDRELRSGATITE